jgi:Kef-type K+ transport system membrane component KefB
VLAAADAHALLADIGVAVLAATVLGLIAHWTRQPIILGYLIAGALVGPTIGFKFIKDQGSIEVISEIGLILLLFIIGLEMNIKALLAAGKQLLVAGFGQFIVCAALGLGLFGLIGYPIRGGSFDGLYLALMWRAVEHRRRGEAAVRQGRAGHAARAHDAGHPRHPGHLRDPRPGLQPNFDNPTAGPILKAWGHDRPARRRVRVSKYVLRWVFSSIARAPEMVVAVSIGWCAAVCALAASMSLSKEMGALIAG